eukprot:scaffold16956_cov63-Phaeocystis_antarctica.AAC.3
MGSIDTCISVLNKAFTIKISVFENPNNAAPSRAPRPAPQRAAGRRASWPRPPRASRGTRPCRPPRRGTRCSVHAVRQAERGLDLLGLLDAHHVLRVGAARLELVVLGEDEDHRHARLLDLGQEVAAERRHLPAHVMHVEHRAERPAPADVLEHQRPPRTLPLVLHLVIPGREARQVGQDEPLVDEHQVDGFRLASD